MKKFKSLVSVVLAGSMLFGLTGCSSRKFEATDKKAFKSALEDVFDLDDGDYNSVSNPTSVSSYSYYSPYLDYMHLFDDYEIKNDIEYRDGDNFYCFIEFDDEEDALEFFEENIYDVFNDVKDDGDYEGKSYTLLNDTTGYVILRGSADSDDFGYMLYGTHQEEYDDDIVAGFFVKDGVFVAVYTESDKDSKIEDLNDFLAAIEYPKV